MRRRLIPHPAYPAPSIEIEAAVARTTPKRIELSYIITGDTARIRLPAPAEKARRDGLWKHTCFELFLRTPGAASYAEFNFSPSSEWAAYSFTGYREGMSEAPLSAPPEASFVVGSGRIAAGFGWSVVGLQLADSSLWSAAATTVIEADDGTMSYWSLAHAPGKPDFHHPDGFILTLPAERL